MAKQTKGRKLNILFYKIKSESVIGDELIYFENRVVIPKMLRDEMLKRIYESDQGVEKSKQLVKQHVYYLKPCPI